MCDESEINEYTHRSVVNDEPVQYLEQHWRSIRDQSNGAGYPNGLVKFDLLNLMSDTIVLGDAYIKLRLESHCVVGSQGLVLKNHVANLVHGIFLSINDKTIENSTQGIEEMQQIRNLIEMSYERSLAEGELIMYAKDEIEDLHNNGVGFGVTDTELQTALIATADDAYLKRGALGGSLGQKAVSKLTGVISDSDASTRNPGYNAGYNKRIHFFNRTYTGTLVTYDVNIPLAAISNTFRSMGDEPLSNVHIKFNLQLNVGSATAGGTSVPTYNKQHQCATVECRKVTANGAGGDSSQLLDRASKENNFYIPSDTAIELWYRSVRMTAPQIAANSANPVRTFKQLSFKSYQQLGAAYNIAFRFQVVTGLANVDRLWVWLDQSQVEEGVITEYHDTMVTQGFLPNVKINNLQCFVNNVPFYEVTYDDAEHYSVLHEQFMKNHCKYETRETSLISYSDFLSNQRIYCVDLSRMDLEESSSFTLTGTPVYSKFGAVTSPSVMPLRINCHAEYRSSFSIQAGKKDVDISNIQ